MTSTRATPLPFIPCRRRRLLHYQVMIMIPSLLMDIITPLIRNKLLTSQGLDLIIPTVTLADGEETSRMVANPTMILAILVIGHIEAVEAEREVWAVDSAAL